MLAWRLLLATGDPRRGRRDRADVFNGVLSGVSTRRGPVLLRQPAPAPHAPGRRRAGDRRAQAVVRLRLLPAEPRADASRAGRRSSRRPTAHGLQVHQYAAGEIAGLRRRRPGPAGRRDRLSVERPGPGRGRRGARRRVDPDLRSPAGRRPRRSTGAAGRARTSRPATARSTRPAGGGPATPSTSSSRCPPGSPSPRPGSTRSAAASRSSAARSSTPSRPPTSPPAWRSRTSASTPAPARAGRAPRPRART